jgi:pyridoxal/pyridoxine/pyridoxamine kinase
MAVNYKWNGVVVTISDSDLTKIIANLNNITATTNTVTAMLGFVPHAMHVVAVARIVSALVAQGANALKNCNSNQKGIVLTVYWVGVPWCVSK